MTARDARLDDFADTPPRPRARRPRSALPAPVSSAVFDLRPFKAEMNRLLPPGNVVRQALAAEPDFLPRDGAWGKLEVYLRLALAQRRA